MKRVSEFKKNQAVVDKKYAPHERDIYYWLEHVVHWHLAILIVSITLLAAYLLFDPHAPAWASF